MTEANASTSGSPVEGASTASCNFCGSDQIVSSEFGIVCTNCSMVLEENVIVNSTEFTKNANGTSSINGQFVGEYCTTPFSHWGGPGQRFTSGGTKDQTILKGKQRLHSLATQLNLDPHFVEAAHRLFILAVQRNFTQGRKIANVLAACLYIVCRREKAPRLLIDFSEVLQTNVFVLGSVYLKFRRLLNIQVPVMEPTHYIDRFAAKLELEGKEAEVSNTARLLAKRMSKDWLSTGRRPAGICGAALLIASRWHGFNRTEEQVIEIMRICTSTLKNRLREFHATPASNLTMQEFLQIDLPEEINPPSLNQKAERGILEDNAQTGTVADKNLNSETAKKAPEKIATEHDAVYEKVELELRQAVKQWEPIVRSKKLLENAPRSVEGNVGNGAEETNEEHRPSVALVVSDTQQRSDNKKPTDLVPLDNEGNIEDADIDYCILSEAEAKKKTAIWNTMYKTYMEEKAERDKTSKPRKRKRKKKVHQPADGVESAAEAARLMVERKRISKKINYDKWNELFGADVGQVSETVS